MMRQYGYTIIDYIDNYIGVGIPSVVNASYESLLQHKEHLGLTVSDKKLVPPVTCITCFGILINLVHGTIEIPADKLQQINVTVQEWLSKCVVTKCQLQSILGLLLYVHKCICPACIFLNRMLDLLKASHATQRITLTHEFKCNLHWFSKFLPDYNEVSWYDHKTFDVTLE